MMKWVDPIVTRFRIWPWPQSRPHVSFVTRHPGAGDGELTPGQQLAERVASGVGSWPFIVGQGVFLFTWFILNVVPWVFHWDPYPWMAANIVMSAEAAFTGPILLIAANVGAARDHKQADRIEGLAKQNEDLSVQNHELSVQNEKLVERLLNVERMLDTHIATSLKAHADELHDLGTLVRAMHAVVCDTAQANGGSQAPATAPTQELLTPVATQPTSEASPSASEPAAPAPPASVRQGKGRSQRN